ncbi:MAG: DUF4012 domain-containing protein [Actinomycetota bacterium]|nr:DUF4012 domain-containing protein [Actinomycetota bacterium]
MRRKRLILAGAIFFIVVASAAAFVLLPVARDLRAAKAALGTNVGDLKAGDIANARIRVASAHDRLNSLPAHLLHLIPFVGANLDAVDRVVTAADPVLESALDLKRTSNDVLSNGLFVHGRINPRRIGPFLGPVREEESTLGKLAAAARDARGGWLFPPVWSALTEIADKANDLGTDAAHAADLLRQTDSLLGTLQPRTYLVLLLNNAELRGGGGVLSGIGTLKVKGGKLTLGHFYTREALLEEPFRKVPAPADYERRFGVFDANTTLWINSTYSPDFPDDALVASRLLKLETGIETDGAIGLDPRGLAALMPPNSSVKVPGLEGRITREGLPRFVYSDAYRLFDNQGQRRRAILAAGTQAFDQVLHGSFDGTDALDELGPQIAGGHIRVVSFQPDEERALDETGVSGALPRPTGDQLFVTVDNLGTHQLGFGTKLDYWAKRRITHHCDIVENSASCSTFVALTNTAPEGLTRYVAGKPYGLMRSYVQVYVPQDAAVDIVDLDGASAAHLIENQDGSMSIGVPVNVKRGQTRTVQVNYTIGLTDDRYTLTALPQPLTADAKLDLSLSMPQDWRVVSASSNGSGAYRSAGAFSGKVEVTAQPSHESGLTRAWSALLRFWRNPVF